MTERTIPPETSRLSLKPDIYDTIEVNGRPLPKLLLGWAGRLWPS